MNDLTQNNLAELAERINTEHRQVEAALRSGLEHARRAGELLLEAKTQCEHGTWLPWLSANCEVADRTAQTYMRIARRWPELAKAQRVADLPLRDAVRLLAEPQEHLEGNGNGLFGDLAANPFCPEALRELLLDLASVTWAEFTPVGVTVTGEPTFEEWRDVGVKLAALDGMIQSQRAKWSIEGVRA